MKSIILLTVIFVRAVMTANNNEVYYAESGDVINIYCPTQPWLYDGRSTSNNLTIIINGQKDNFGPKSPESGGD